MAATRSGASVAAATSAYIVSLLHDTCSKLEVASEGACCSGHGQGPYYSSAGRNSSASSYAAPRPPSGSSSSPRGGVSWCSRVAGSSLLMRSASEIAPRMYSSPSEKACALCWSTCRSVAPLSSSQLFSQLRNPSALSSSLGVPPRLTTPLTTPRPQVNIAVLDNFANCPPMIPFYRISSPLTDSETPKTRCVVPR